MLVEMSAGRAGQQGLELLFQRSPSLMAVLEGIDHKIVSANNAFIDLVGKRAQVGKSLADALPDYEQQGIDKILDGVARSGQAFVGHGMSFTVERADGSTERVLVDFVFQPLASSEGQAPSIFIHGSNFTEDPRNDTLRMAHNKVLELAIADAPLESTLSELIRMVESTSCTGVLGSILLLDPDEVHLRVGAAPSLPPEYSAILDGAAIGDCRGSCGTAAYLGAAVFVSDIETDPLWADFKHLPLAYGLRACWSIPILTCGRKVLGTFGMYHREPREPTARDLMLVNLITQTAALVIDRERAKSALQNFTTMNGRSPDYQSSPAAPAN
ncbi:GAF domain-containing protein [Sphingomonas sp. NSE70-1]|uniref:GAF domain-containing protein n=1 Tax=Sphingomonas caseinilyticus TaxID=2908205 RepID=A0ABT0RWY5_9SPHN|nr:GAF domain-containing protein [Sphingomonas caseinilyticus]MCL6699534.1 GAF domain-containing protein [Sphingomonas caseinilyticus]